MRDSTKNGLICMTVFALIVIMFSMVSAEGITHQQNTDLNYTMTSNFATYCTLTTINTPNGFNTIEVNGTLIGSQTFLFEITGSNFSSLGNYRLNIACFGGSTVVTEYQSVEVTTDGLTGKLGFTILILILSLGIIVLGLWKQDPIVTLLGSFGLYFIGLNILFYGLDGFKDPVYTWAFGLITLAIAFYVSVRSAWELIID
jgi:hypothetical protein